MGKSVTSAVGFGARGLGGAIRKGKIEIVKFEADAPWDRAGPAGTSR